MFYSIFEAFEDFIVARLWIGLFIFLRFVKEGVTSIDWDDFLFEKSIDLCFIGIVDSILIKYRNEKLSTIKSQTMQTLDTYIHLHDPLLSQKYQRYSREKEYSHQAKRFLCISS